MDADRCAALLPGGHPEPVLTALNTITVVRTVVSIILEVTAMALELVAAGRGAQHVVHRAGVPGGTGRLGYGVRQRGPGRQDLVVPAIASAGPHCGVGGGT